MKVWSRSNIIGILLLLLLAGDVETNPGPTTGTFVLIAILLPYMQSSRVFGTKPENIQNPCMNPYIATWYF